MKAHLRLLLVLLISLALPVSSMAALEQSAEPCQMQSDMGSSGHLAHQAEAQEEDAHSHEGNPLCESGHQCKTGSMLQAGIAQPHLAASLPQLAVHYPEFFPARSNADVWRPPRY
ncbi:Uncharacterised protein [Stutzerimonas stutzeri]|uniref:hypothetical protein n=1 Tax=Stutzerimonas stutzeri subgroup TaxID=578833 RepID=UPI000C6D3E1A|nr:MULTISPECIES: hypothetical protein [Stutzerimonas stutzeri subgroup]MCQ2046206.1 hypothetical protein [Stutzerimonas kunmingensis]PKR26901.1 hypothetical protein CXK90_14895 [Stutzerimonas stutzeri]QQC09707.1 hypothetical protein I6I22_12590 [Stutzerimonas stutzeri]VEI34645.1 Uncharacterised protein [Stutzerimonas stutzeri]